MRKICFVTGSRADYSSLYPVMKLALNSKKLKFQLIATCMHLSPKFGNTYKEIQNDGFKIDAKIKVPINSDHPKIISQATGRVMIGLSNAYNRLKPDIVVLLGDRFEALAAAFAAASAKIPIAHIYGGETTAGALDECIRHSITKMSSFHFVTTEVYKKRVTQLGENPATIHTVGAIAIERIKKIKLFSKKNIEQTLNFKFDKTNIVITYHPVTLNKKSASNEIKEILGALDKLPNTKKIFTMSNADSGNDIIYKMIKKFSKDKKNNSVFFKSLGQKMYFSVMKNCNLVLGNSSSGIIEAPSLKVPSIDIGDRQKGRTRSKTVITCKAEKKDILKAMRKGLSKNFIKASLSNKNPYEKNNTSKNILDTLTSSNLKNILKKIFYDY